MEINVSSFVKVLAILIVSAEADILETVLVELEITKDGFDVGIHTPRHDREHHAQAQALDDILRPVSIVVIADSALLLLR